MGNFPETYHDPMRDHCKSCQSIQARVTLDMGNMKENTTMIESELFRYALDAEQKHD